MKKFSRWAVVAVIAALIVLGTWTHDGRFTSGSWTWRLADCFCFDSGPMYDSPGMEGGHLYVSGTYYRCWPIVIMHRSAPPKDRYILQRSKPPVLSAVGWGIVFLAVLLWFLWKQRICITVSFVLRHVAFLLCVYLGLLWLLFEGQIIPLIFGHVVYKHSPDETPAVLVTLGGVIFWFAAGVFLLGKNRRVEFIRYVETFPVLRRFIKQKDEP